mmetsp:Transcript_50009/g.106401  ORF Transcript_50009/g.106401 Transcript_50009/m.106401 type:complete len:214 (-) Transcript_50009:922-1563(-)
MLFTSPMPCWPMKECCCGGPSTSPPPCIIIKYQHDGRAASPATILLPSDLSSSYLSPPSFVDRSMCFIGLLESPALTVSPCTPAAAAAASVEPVGPLPLSLSLHLGWHAKLNAPLRERNVPASTYFRLPPIRRPLLLIPGLRHLLPPAPGKLVLHFGNPFLHPLPPLGHFHQHLKLVFSCWHYLFCLSNSSIISSLSSSSSSITSSSSTSLAL